MSWPRDRDDNSDNAVIAVVAVTVALQSERMQHSPKRTLGFHFVYLTIFLYVFRCCRLILYVSCSLFPKSLLLT